MTDNENYGRNSDFITAEMNSIIARKMDRLMNTVHSQFQRAINNDITEHVLP